jgi:hypothetical protein
VPSAIACDGGTHLNTNNTIRRVISAEMVVQERHLKRVLAPADSIITRRHHYYIYSA